MKNCGLTKAQENLGKSSESSVGFRIGSVSQPSYLFQTFFLFCRVKRQKPKCEHHRRLFYRFLFSIHYFTSVLKKLQ